MANEIDLQKIALPFFGITARRYYQLSKDGIVPPPEKGKIDILRAGAAYIAYQRKLLQGSGSLTLTDERTRETKLKADLLERELAEQEGALLSYEEVKTAWVRVLSAVRSRLLSIPTKYAPLLFGRSIPEIKEKVEEGIYQALTELSELKYEAMAEAKKKPMKRKKKTA
jgi:phage terminase Nu1 subunit (DNA packaging protein)